MTHEHKYPAHTQITRLQTLDLTPTRYQRMYRGATLRRDRESAIPQEDVNAVIDLIVEYPHIGSLKAHHTLVDRERGLVSSGFINQAKQEMIRLAESEYSSRKEEEKSLEKDLRDRQQPSDYEHIQAEYKNHIWAIDFVDLRFFGFGLCLCVVYDIYTQAYHSILAGSGCDRDLAHRCITAAVKHNGGESAVLLRRDNGSAFTTDTVQNLLNYLFMQDNPIPPASPWFNGSLESNNTGLKATVKTMGMQRLADDSKFAGLARKSEDDAIKALQGLCDNAFASLNNEISRPKFGMPPQQLIDGNENQTRNRHTAFKEKRKKERKERMKEIRSSSIKTNYKSFMSKAKSAIKRKLSDMPTDKLFAFNESIHGRFAAIEL